MPAARMRRTTRISGVVQGGDGARVLRSGRRLWPDNDVKLRKKTAADELLKSVQDAPRAQAVPSARKNGWQAQPVSKGMNSIPLDVDENLDDPVSRESDAGRGAWKMFGIVYSRKRKRCLGGKNSNPSDIMYGTYYVRQKKKRLSSSIAYLEDDAIQPRMLAVTFMGFQRNLHLLATFFSSILTYMRNISVGLKELTAFLSSQPIAMAFAKGGISFLLEPSYTDGSRCCKIYYSTGMILLFSVNFSSLPLCFMYIHSTLLLEAERSSLDLLIHPTDLLEDNEDRHLLDSSGVEVSVTELMSTYDSPLSSLVSTGSHREVMHLKTLPKSTNRAFRRKRTSRKSKQAHNISSFCLQRSIRGRSVSDFFTVSNRAPRPYRYANQFHRKPACRTLDVNKKEFMSTKLGLRDYTALTSCSANVLVIEADKCYREEGAYITLERYPTNEWFLVVTRNGQIRCYHKAGKIMRPCSSNHVTHDIIWTVADCLKLEFLSKGDWRVFKELYKECAERNMPASIAKFIPVPRVIKVSGYGDEQSDLFLRPESYISQIGDEVSQALARRNPNYDMDSEDEEWLNRFNNYSHKENSTVEHVSDETFELIIDSFEKASYFMPDDFENAKVPANLCSDLCSKEVLEVVNSYWINKRKKKQSVLLRVFQVHGPLKDLIDHNNILNRRRQSKQTAAHSTNAKQQRTEGSSVKCFASKNAAEELDVLVKVETADALARQSMDLAVRKRSIAQILMVHANLMMYKAKMSIKIAEKAQNTGTPELADATYFIHPGPSPTHPSS